MNGERVAIVARRGMVNRWATPLVVALLFAAARGRAQEFRLFPAGPASRVAAGNVEGADAAVIVDLTRSYPWNAAPAGFRIDVRWTAESPPAAPLSPPRPEPPRETPVHVRPTALTTSGVLFAASLYSFSSGWRHGFQGFHFTQEHFFGADTYAGGADKCSHFIVSASLARELALVYDRQGLAPRQSDSLAFGVTALAGLLVEMGDGISPYGFSWEDFAVDAVGTATGLLLTRRGLNDLIGLRIGKVPGISESKATASLGVGYSNEIYSADLKLAGLSRRMRFDPGPARFLLVSVTYNTKGYGHVPPLPFRTREVGLELGLNLPEIMAAVGVPEATWWGGFLYKSLNFFRVPFTSFGYRYDLNHGRWHGPDTGDKFP